MLSTFALPPTIQQEEFSRAYVAAIASAAGYSANRRPVDVDCIDVDIRQRSDGIDFPLIDCLSIQAKCTYAHSPRDGYLHFPLKVATYNNLCQARLSPRILVVVHIPQDISKWLTHNSDCIILRYNAYWLSLRGERPIQGVDTSTVRIPTHQCFTVEWLRKTMDNLAGGIQL
jgi:hypothetical protein